MSYCVNCGVELAPSERSCPLCNVVVHNPAQPWTEPQSRPYPARVDKIVDQVNRSYGVGLASLFLLIPTVVSLLTNLLTSHAVSWSAYVVGACFLLYVAVLAPMLFKKPNPYICLALDAVVLAAYLALIDLLSGGARWFLTLGLPIVFLIALFAVVIVAMIRKKDFSILNKAGILFIAVAVLCVALELLLNIHHGKSLMLNWSLYAAAPCIIFSVMLFYTEKHQAFKEKIRRRLFY